MARPNKGRKRTWRFRLNEATILEVSAPAGTTEAQVRRRGRISVVLATFAAAAVAVGVALADNTVADGDGVAPVEEHDVAFGDIDCGVAATKTALVAIKRNGNYPSTNVFAKSTTATVTVHSVSVTTGSGLSAVMDVSPAQISIPSNWDTIAQNTMTGSVSSTVTVASSTPGPGSGTVTYRASGAGSADTSPSPLTRDDSFNVTWNVLDDCSSNTPPVADAGDDVGGGEGSAIPLDGSGSSDADSDPLTYSWVIDTTGIDGGGTCSFDDASSASPEVTCTDDGVFTATLTVTDPSGASDSDDATMTVNNVDPMITAFACPTDPVAVSTSVSLGGSFTDSGTNDTHNNAGTKYDWDDGSATTQGTVNEAAGTGSVSGNHTYMAAGIYTPSLTVTDDDGGSDSETCEYVVVYDPSAGFVTGGGWIWSPAGAYLADPSMTGKATFGFVSKYKKGATTPEGSTEFQFHAAGLNFKSTAYQWLVVAGSKATYKGWGTINGQGSYGFLLAAVDGSPDMFRIKIWDVGSSDVVYDNNLGGGDDADPATEIGGGSIVIHTGKK